MAIRPVILLYQDIATPTVTPTAPDLNCLVVGPAYHIQDYFDPGTANYADKTDIQVGSVYGALEGNPATALPTGSAVLTVAEPPNNAIGALLDASSVAVYFDEARVVIATASDGVTSATTPNTFTSASATWNTAGANKVNPGDRVTVSDGSAFFTRTVYAINSNTSLTFTSDIPSSGFTAGSAQSFRIERQVNDVVVDAAFYAVNGNILTLDGGVTLPVVGQGNKLVSYAKVFIAYRSLRQDLVELDTVESTAEIISKLGRIDARNPLAVGTFVALQNTTSVIQFCGVTSNDLVGHTTVRDALSARPDIYAIVPMTTDVSVLAMWNTDCVGLALPDEDEGRPQRFRAVIGSGSLTSTKTLVTARTTGEPQTVTGTAPTPITKIVLTGVANLVTGGVIPGDKLTVTVTSAAGTVTVGTYTIASVTSATTLEVDTTTPFAGAGTCNITAQIFRSNGTTSRIASAALVGVVTSAGDDLFLVLKDATGTFVASGVAVGDLIQVASNPNIAPSDAGNLTSYVVAAVLSDQRLQIANNGQDMSSVANELPHGVKRIGEALVGTTSVNYRIVRTLNKGQQVHELVTLAQSFNSKRTVLVWPDKVDVAGVVGGTAQPGYYLSCAVGGMTAGLPSQQGFTNLGIAGVSHIYNANTYFTDAQMTELSNGGWYVFAQQTSTSLPYTIHQLTTDPSTLESGEFSVVKNFDFVSMFFVDILEDFLGQYNITSEALTLLQAALNSGGDLLKLRTVSKIGAPITSFAITDLGVSDVSEDRVVAYVAIGLPKPLNVIELHLVA